MTVKGLNESEPQNLPLLAKGGILEERTTGECIEFTLCTKEIPVGKTEP